MKDVPFYELLYIDSSRERHLKILRDSSNSEGGDYRWRDLTWARRVDVAPPLEIGVAKPGETNDVTMDIGACAPILSARAAEVARSLAGNDIQLIPARVESESVDCSVMNILSVVPCLDEEKTQHVEKWTEHSARPDRIGEYKSLWGIVIDPAKAVGRNVFRLWGSCQHIIVSRLFKEAFEREAFTGVAFADVCSPKRSLAEEVKAKAAEHVESKGRYEKFYGQLLEPLVEVYGSVRKVSSPRVVGFDGGGPISICTFGSGENEAFAAYATCELAVREEQKPSSHGRFELFTVCDDLRWATLLLTKVAQMSMRDVLDDGHTVDLVASSLQMFNFLEGALLELFTWRKIGRENIAIFRCVGITRSELEFARREGVEELRRRLLAADAYAATKTLRASVI